MTDFFDDDDNYVPQPEPVRGGDTQIQIRTSNANVGALRVAVPRDIGKVMAAIDQMAQIFGHKWKYSIPFRDKKRGVQLVEGPTVGCALDIARAWGNCSTEVEKVEENQDGWTYYAVFMDIETGFRLVRPFRQRRSQNIGTMGGDRGRAEDITFQIGASKALRNVVVNALRGIVDEALERGEHRLTKKIERNRDKVIGNIRNRLAEYNIEETRVARFFAAPLDELKAHHLAQIIKQLQSIKDSLMSPMEFCQGSITAPVADEVAQHDIPEHDEDGVIIEPGGSTTDQDHSTEKRERERIKVEIDGKTLGKTKFLRFIKQSIKEGDENLAEKVAAARATAVGSAPEMWEEVDQLMAQLLADMDTNSGEEETEAHDQTEKNEHGIDLDLDLDMDLDLDQDQQDDIY